ncbi:NupC/NupG family nucleoside CNT transporter [Taibaiella lutea]|nr:nucleoside transporter C-terminal domain-containing protein [Taibaiella lutea]
MERFTGLIGIVLILGIAFLFSNNKRRINLRLVFSGLALQLFIAVLILQVQPVRHTFSTLGKGMQKIEQFAKRGTDFVYGGVVVDNGTYPASQIRIDTVINKDGLREIHYFLKRGGSGMTESIATPVINANGEYVVHNNYSRNGFVFAFNITAIIILVCILVAVLYYIGLMQAIVAVIAKGMNYIMQVSGAEALSNVASAFVGQIEAQIMIRPYLKGMTKSELLSSMSGSLACIAGGILVVYSNMGAEAGMDIAPTLIMASLMAAPGALVISKIVFPETEESQTRGKIKLELKNEYTNLIDAISHGAIDGFKIAMNVIAMLIGFMALIALVDWCLLHVGHIFNPAFNLSLDWIFAKLFYPLAWAMGIPDGDINNAATLLGQKLTVNEFLAFKNLTSIPGFIKTPKGLAIITTAICGFANFSSVGMQIGGIGALAPERRADLARLGLKALLCGTLASYLSASIVGILM